MKQGAQTIAQGRGKTIPQRPAFGRRVYRFVLALGGVLLALGIGLGVGIVKLDPPDLLAITTATPPLAEGVRRLLERSPVLMQKYGHYPYHEADAESLMVVGSYTAQGEPRFEQLQRDAGLALMRMIDAARHQGVWLVTVSGFRDRAHQGQLFQRETRIVGSEARAATTIAPPGYSEHHTGYAVDLLDGLAPWQAFEKTPAFQWLLTHADVYGFELSFPENNPQGIRFEPWHWRYVGSPQAQRLFQSASGASGRGG